jgi:hypothetical protein
MIALVFLMKKPSHQRKGGEGPAMH